MPAVRALRAQSQSPRPGFSTTVQVVSLFATVRDAQGQVVKDLTADDFRLEEDGQPQTIRYFSRETDLPLTLGLLVDTSISQSNLLRQERSASLRFFDKVMRPDKDRAFIIPFDSGVELLQDVTSSKSDLQRSLGQIRTGMGLRSAQWEMGYRVGLSKRTPDGAGGTDLYDAVYLGVEEILKKQDRRRVLIILSDGVDIGSKETIFSAVESAQRSDAMIYSILFADPDFYRGRRNVPDGRKALERMAAATGGNLFEVSRAAPIDKVYESLVEELRSQYSIGYTPESRDRSREFRRIHLATRQNLTVQTREGYYVR